MYYNVLQYLTMYYNITSYNVLQHNILQYLTKSYNLLQSIANTYLIILIRYFLFLKIKTPLIFNLRGFNIFLPY